MLPSLDGRAARPLCSRALRGAGCQARCGHCQLPPEVPPMPPPSSKTSAPSVHFRARRVAEGREEGRKRNIPLFFFAPGLVPRVLSRRRCRKSLEGEGGGEGEEGEGRGTDVFYPGAGGLPFAPSRLPPRVERTPCRSRKRPPSTQRAPHLPRSQAAPTTHPGVLLGCASRRANATPGRAGGWAPRCCCPGGGVRVRPGFTDDSGSLLGCDSQPV